MKACFEPITPTSPLLVEVVALKATAVPLDAEPRKSGAKSSTDTTSWALSLYPLKSDVHGGKEHREQGTMHTKGK